MQAVDARILPGRPPIASILRLSPGNCGTSLVVDGINSEAFDGATIESYTWTLFLANNQEIDSFTGSGDDRLERGVHRLGGDYRAPFINFPSYHAYAALRANVSSTLDRTTVFQNGLDLSDQSYRLFFATSMEKNVPVEGSSVTVQIVNQVETFTVGTFDVNKERFTGHAAEFTLPQGFASGTNAGLLFNFAGDGERWLDNVTLLETLTGDVANENESFETGRESPWFLGDGVVPLGGVSAREIETDFRDDEIYSLTLLVTDSNGLRSEVDTIEVLGVDCLEPF